MQTGEQTRAGVVSSKSSFDRYHALRTAAVIHRTFVEVNLALRAAPTLHADQCRVAASVRPDDTDNLTYRQAGRR